MKQEAVILSKNDIEDIITNLQFASSALDEKLSILTTNMEYLKDLGEKLRNVRDLKEDYINLENKLSEINAEYAKFKNEIVSFKEELYTLKASFKNDFKKINEDTLNKHEKILNNMFAKHRKTLSEKLDKTGESLVKNYISIEEKVDELRGDFEKELREFKTSKLNKFVTFFALTTSALNVYLLIKILNLLQ